MSCMNCGALSFSPKVSPFGCFFCTNDHAQCETCNRDCNERCAICTAPTEFVEMVKSKSPGGKAMQACDGQLVVENEESEPQRDVIRDQCVTSDQEEASETHASVASFQRSWRSCKGCADDDLAGVKGWRRHKMRRRLHGKKLERTERFKSLELLSFLEMSKSLEDLGVLNKHGSGVIFATNELNRRRSQSLGGGFSFDLQQIDCYTDEGRGAWAHGKELEVDESSESHVSPMRIQAGEQLQSLVGSDTKDTELKMQMKDRMFHIVELERMRRLLELEAEGEKSELLRIHKEQQKRFMHAQTAMSMEKDRKNDQNDVRMEKIIKTLKEEPRKSLMISESELKISHSEKAHSEYDQFNSQTQSEKPEPAEVSDTREASRQAAQAKLNKRTFMKSAEKYLSRVRRALCVPFKMTVTSDTNCFGSPTYKVEPPAAQSMAIPAAWYEVEAVLNSVTRRIEKEENRSLGITRGPIKCPDADCRNIVFISDLNTHFIQDHAATTMERIACGQVKSFFLDAALSREGEPKCHIVYLAKYKNLQLGRTEYDNMLPVLVMSCRVHLLDLCGYNRNNIEELKKSNATDEILMIWLTGLVPENEPITATLAVWPLQSDHAENHTVHTCNIYSIRNSQSVRDIYNSNCAMYLTWPMVEHMSNNGLKMIGAQVIIN